MERIFISYSRKDEEFARRLATHLSDAGADVWIDVEDIPVGMKWSSAIQEGLDTADALLVILSPDSMASTNVEDEWQYFMDANKPVIPVFYRPARIHFQLNRLQYIDFYTQSFEDAFQELLYVLTMHDIKLAGAPDTPAELIETAGLTPEPAERQTRRPLLVYRGQDVTSVLYMAVGGMLIFALAIALGLWIVDNTRDDPPAATDTPDVENPISDAFLEPLPALAYETDELVVHSSAASGETFTIGNAVIAARALVNGRMWYQFFEDASDTEGWQIAENIPGYSRMQLRIVPFLVAWFETTAQILPIYNDASPDAERATAQVDETVGVYGFAYDAVGNLWYQIDVFLGNANIVAWVEAEQIAGIENSAHYETPLADVPLITETRIISPAIFEADPASVNPDELRQVQAQTVIIAEQPRVFVIDARILRDKVWLHIATFSGDRWVYGWTRLENLALTDPERAYLKARATN